MDPNQFVLTTDQLAQAFETSSNTLLKNFRRHKEDFVEETHYYLLEGEELKQFLSIKFADLSGRSTNVAEDSQSPTNFVDFSGSLANFVPDNSSDADFAEDSESLAKFVEDSRSSTNKIRSLYLWTLKGAFEHAWLLKSPQAKQAYEKIMDQANRPANVQLLEAHNSQLTEQNVRLLEEQADLTRRMKEVVDRVWEGSQSPDHETKNRLLSQTDFQEILRIIRLLNTAALDMKRVKAITPSDFRLLIDRLEQLKTVVERQAAYEDAIMETGIADVQQQLVGDIRQVQQEKQAIRLLLQEYQALLPGGPSLKQIESSKEV